MKIFNNAYLIPFGSAWEPIHGLSHLLEHLLITHLVKFFKKGVFGYTTEDYIMILTNQIEYSEFINFFRECVFDKKDFTKQKQIIIEEISKEANSESTKFFARVLDSTDYAHSPLGEINELKSVTTQDIQEIRKNLIHSPILAWNLEEGFLENMRENTSSIDFSIPTLNSKLKFRYEGNPYYAYYFHDHVDGVIMLYHLFQTVNPELLVQMCERKNLTILILDEQAIIPDLKKTTNLLSTCRQKITCEYKNNSKEPIKLALKELVSFYQTGRLWTCRIENIMQWPIRQIDMLLEQFLNYEKTA